MFVFLVSIHQSILYGPAGENYPEAYLSDGVSIYFKHETRSSLLAATFHQNSMRSSEEKKDFFFIFKGFVYIDNKCQFSIDGNYTCAIYINI